MQTREIPREEWQDYLSEFSKQHEGWQVTIEVVGMDVGDQIIAREWPLQGISCNRFHDAPDGSSEGISVTAGDTPERHISHMVTHPTSLRVAQTDDGRDQGVQIESEDGPMTLVTFRAPMSPEMYDR